MDDSSALDVSVESDTVDTANYSAQFGKEEYTYDDGYGITYHFIVLKYNSDQILITATYNVA